MVMPMNAQEPLDTYIVTDPEQAVALLNPLRAQILAHLREPASASEVARAMNEAPQRINYHLKALEKTGLVRRAGTRQVRNLVEVLYTAIARSFVLSETLGFEPETVRRMKEEGSLAHLVHASDKLKRDALKLLERSETGETVHSATLAATVRLASDSERQSFVQEYMEAVRRLTEKYGGATGNGEDGAAFQLLAAVYPQILEGGQ
jgi:DNA-binding transcriptional ArsR family regulator